MNDAVAATGSDQLLTSGERNRLNVFEGRMKDAFMSPFVIGTSLKGIRDEKLFKEEFKSFKDYCEKRWNIKYNRADQLIRASDALENLEGSEILPANERQIRPLLELGGPLQKQTWDEIVDKSGGKNITGELVKKIVDKIVNKDKPAPKKKAALKQEIKSGSLEDVKDLIDGQKQRIREEDIIDSYNQFLRYIIFLARIDNYHTISEPRVFEMMKNLFEIVKPEGAGEEK